MGFWVRGRVLMAPGLREVTGGGSGLWAAMALPAAWRWAAVAAGAIDANR